MLVSKCGAPQIQGSMKTDTLLFTMIKSHIGIVVQRNIKKSAQSEAHHKTSCTVSTQEGFHVVAMFCSQVSIRDKVFDVLMYFINFDDTEVRNKALTGMGEFPTNHNVVGRPVPAGGVCGHQAKSDAHERKVVVKVY